ncbi:MAG: PAS domain S-box protein, partial [Myxococcales bacterium]
MSRRPRGGSASAGRPSTARSSDTACAPQRGGRSEARGAMLRRKKKESFEARRQRLAKSDAYRALFEHLPDCLLIYDQEARVVDATVGALELFGYTRSELGEVELCDLYPQDGGRSLREALKSVFGNRVGRFEIQCRKKNGEIFPAEISASRCQAGGESMIQVVVRDVGQTVRIVRCLRENDEITRSILNCALDAIISVDVTGDVLEFNPAAEKMFEYSRAEAVGCAAADLIVPHGLREQYHAVLRRCVAGKGEDWLGRRIESLAMRRNGRVFPVELRIGRVRRGETQTFTAYLSDISERKEAVSRLAEEKDKLSAILSATSDGMVLLDGSGSVLYANRSFEEMLGCSAEVICGSPAADLGARLMRLDPDPADAFAFALGVGDAARATEQPLFRRCRISGDVKRTLRVSWLALGAETDGRYGRLAVFRDVTWEDEAHRAKDDLIGNVSHELRTPLTSIQGFVQLMSEEKAGPISAKQHKVLGIIGENVERLKQLVGDLLDVDRVATASLSAEAFELDGLLR